MIYETVSASDYIVETTDVTLSASDAETLVVAAGVNLIATADFDCIYGTEGNDTIVEDGNIFGAYGIVIAQGNNNYVSVGAQGSVAGAQSAISLGSADNSVVNDGEINGLLADGIELGDGGNNIVNHGTISGYVYGIFAMLGADFITNTGTITSQTGQTIIALNGSNHLINSGKIISSGGTVIEAVHFDDGGNAINNSGAISSQGNAILCTDGNDSISNSGSISGFGATIVISGTLGKSTVDNSGFVYGESGPAVSLAGNGNTVNNSGDIKATAETLSLDGNGYDIDNSKLISASGEAAIYNDGQSASIRNSGTISARFDTIYLFTTSANVGEIVNSSSGVIEAADGNAVLTTDGVESLTNDGAITGRVQLGYSADASSSDTLVNSGKIDGATTINGKTAALTNSGAIVGAVKMGAGADTLVNSGAIIGAVTFAGATSVFANHGQVYGDVTLFSGNTLNNTGVIHGDIALSTNDMVNDSRGMVTGTITCGASDDTFVFGGAFGQETIDKFKAGGAAGHDTLQFNADDFTSFSGVKSHMTQAGGDILIKLDATDTIVLAGIKLSDMVAADFKFV